MMVFVGTLLPEKTTDAVTYGLETILDHWEQAVHALQVCEKDKNDNKDEKVDEKRMKEKEMRNKQEW